jgi:hypothetical protein
VNEFGDGHLQLHYEKIRVARTGDLPDFALPPFNSLFGQLTPFQLHTEGSSPGISLEVLPEPPAGRVVAHFDPPPSAERPQTLIAEILGAHTFAMDRKELAVASGGDALGDLDNTSITLDLENVRELVFEISLPETMSLTHDPPFVHAYQYFLSGDQSRRVFDSALTLRTSENLYYSPLLRTIFITVKNPPQRTAYYVYWRLGNPLSQFEPPTPFERARLTARRNGLHSVRESFAAPDPASEPRRKEVLEILAKLGTDVIALLKASIANNVTDEGLLPALLQNIEITVLAFESAEGNTLQFVAGTGISQPDFWNHKFLMGEGIGGRAAKHLQVQIYDDQEAKGTVIAGIYRELEPGKRHAWLVSIPLTDPDCGDQAIGVLNIGTFDPRSADVLRVLKEQLDELDELSFEVLNAVLAVVLSK